MRSQKYFAKDCCCLVCVFAWGECWSLRLRDWWWVEWRVMVTSGVEQSRVWPPCSGFCVSLGPATPRTPKVKSSREILSCGWCSGGASCRLDSLVGPARLLPHWQLRPGMGDQEHDSISQHPWELERNFEGLKWSALKNKWSLLTDF